MSRKKIDELVGLSSLEQYFYRNIRTPPVVTTAVRYTLQSLAEAYPGHAVEVRVPPFGAVQCIEGQRHRRGTPPNVVETDATTWMALAVGELFWSDAVQTGRVDASGDRSDLSLRLPVPGLYRFGRQR